MRCGKHKNGRKERQSLIKLHLVKQTSLHSSCQSGRIYVVVSKDWYLRELTETNLEHGRPYIIHSAPRPCTQLRFPDAAQTAAGPELQLWGFFGKSQLMKNFFHSFCITIEKVSQGKAEVSSLSQWPLRVT